MNNKPKVDGEGGGPWTSQTHNQLYAGNLNKGLARFIAEQLSPVDMLEFGSGVCSLANYLASLTPLHPPYCIEPEIVVEVAPNLNLLNIDVFSVSVPKVLNKRFDLVLSIEVAEHIEFEKHEELFNFLVSRANRWIVFSGARPGQGGHGHVAERPEFEWREEFTSRGCTFDARMSALARTYCDQKNINHRQNVQVFRAPIRSAALETLETRARPYLSDLLSIIQANGGSMTGGLFYVDISGARGGMPEHALHWKRENLLALAQNSETILEIGFAGGHSALIFLLANPDTSITIIDPMHLPYAQPCFEYLNRMFPGRITLETGLSQDVLPKLEKKNFDLVHLDGGKDATIKFDLEAIKALVARDHVLAIDDTQNPKLEAVVSEWEASGYLESGAFEKMNECSSRARWTHRICRFPEAETDASAIISSMALLYKGSDLPSIYTKQDEKGSIAGFNRAAGLIKAMREAETLGLTGAFVEVGIAAGHSSVIAALSSSRFFPRDFYLYDTFSGFSEDLPDERDLNGVSIRDYDLPKYLQEDCSKPSVEARMLEAGVPIERLMMIQGRAEETLTRIKPATISVLRLDADLYDPTYTALTELFDRIESGGFLIVDDYGHWKGCREAVDHFFAERNLKFCGTPWDYTCYMLRR